MKLHQLRALAKYLVNSEAFKIEHPNFLHLYLRILADCNDEGELETSVTELIRKCPGIKTGKTHRDNKQGHRVIKMGANLLDHVPVDSPNPKRKRTKITVKISETYSDILERDEKQMSLWQVQKPLTETPHRDIEDKKVGKKRTAKPVFSAEGKRKFFDHVYLSDKQMEEIKAYYLARDLKWEDLKTAMQFLDAWYENNPAMRQVRTNDAKTLKGWPLERALQRRKAMALTKPPEPQNKTFRVASKPISLQRLLSGISYEKS